MLHNKYHITFFRVVKKEWKTGLYFYIKKLHNKYISLFFRTLIHSSLILICFGTHVLRMTTPSSSSCVLTLLSSRLIPSLSVDPRVDSTRALQKGG